MAAAAVTPPEELPWETSRLEEVSFSSSIFICSTFSALPLICWIWMGCSFSSAMLVSTSTMGSDQSKNWSLLTPMSFLAQKRGLDAITVFSKMACDSLSMYIWGLFMTAIQPKP